MYISTVRFLNLEIKNNEGVRIYQILVIKYVENKRNVTG